MSKVEKVKFIRTLTVLGCTIAAVISMTSLNPLVGAISVLPFTCLSGVCAFMYHKLDKSDKDKVYKPSALHLRTIAMHPYYLFVAVLFINILCVVSHL